MRISDWSSDVCSSDLHGFRFRKLREFVHHEADGFRPHCATTLVFLPRAIGEEVSAKHFIEKRGDVGEGLSFGLVDADVERDRQPFAGVDVAHAAQIHAGEEIGRAAGRERVCQYVWISVVAVSLKKKERA